MSAALLLAQGIADRPPSVGHGAYLIIAALLFTIGAVGVLVRRNVLVMFMCVELMLNAVNLTFVTFARELDDIGGQALVFFVLVVAAADGPDGPDGGSGRSTELVEFQLVAAPLFIGAGMPRGLWRRISRRFAPARDDVRPDPRRPERSVDRIAFRVEREHVEHPSRVLRRDRLEPVVDLHELLLRDLVRPRRLIRQGLELLRRKAIRDGDEDAWKRRVVPRDVPRDECPHDR